MVYILAREAYTILILRYLLLKRCKLNAIYANPSNFSVSECMFFTDRINQGSQFDVICYRRNRGEIEHDKNIHL